ncbi:hypothetical protein [Thermocatellispora tengchongensis]|uniref:hypothetical protein n=1 Tax=Thermocatellispora tengchongensis TaxID=1073253 RepID=UPI0036356E89
MLAAGAAALVLVLAITLIPRAAETGQPAGIAAAAGLHRAEHPEVADRPAPPVQRIGSYGSATVYSYTEPRPPSACAGTRLRRIR